MDQFMSPYVTLCTRDEIRNYCFLMRFKASTCTEESTPNDLLQSGCQLLACKINYYSMLDTAQTVVER